MIGKKCLFRSLLVLVVLLAGAPVFGGALEPDRGRIVENYGQLPLLFIENRGQMDPSVNFYVQGPGHALFFTPEGMTLALQAAAGPAAVVRLTPLRLAPGVTLAGRDPQAAKVNYFLGNDPRKWRTNLPTYGAVVYRGAYPGIDLKFYGQGRQLEYDLFVRPGAKPAQVKFLCTGIAGLKVTPEGDLEMRLPDGGTLVQKKPCIYQEVEGRQVPREGKFTVQQDRDGFVYGFEVAAYDARHPLVIDPALVYSTYLGGTSSDSGAAITVDALGSAYVTGQTASFDFPQKNVPLKSPLTPNAFVTKLAPGGNSLVFSTLLGGSATDAGTGIAFDAAGNVYVTGFTDSLDFPLRNAFQNRKKGGTAAFVTKLSPGGNSLIFSTFLGGEADDRASAIAADPAGNAFVTGTTFSSDFPVLKAFQPIILGGGSAFVTRFNPNGSVAFSTFLGGHGDDSGSGIAVDPGGNTYITGTTSSRDFPTKNAFQGQLLGTTNAFVTKFDFNGVLVFSTFLGGSQADAGRAITVAIIGGVTSAFVTGDTTSYNFPLKNPFQPFKPGVRNAFVTRLDFNLPGTAALLGFSTYLGGFASDQGLGIALDSLGRAIVTGVTSSFNFPTRNPLQPVIRGGTDAFVTKLNASGNGLVFSTFLGGDASDQGQGIAVQADNAFVTGVTSSFNFPTNKPFQAINRGGTDAFVTKISP